MNTPAITPAVGSSVGIAAMLLAMTATNDDWRVQVACIIGAVVIASCAALAEAQVRRARNETEQARLLNQPASEDDPPAL